MVSKKEWKNNASGHSFIASFSGGKDSTLALYQAQKVGKAMGLVIMMEEDGKRSRSHGMPPELIQAQARSIGLPVYTAAATWTNYEEKYISLLEKAKNDGAEVLVTGDLDIPEHGCWHEKVADKVGLKLGMPLWEMGREKAVEEFIDLGFVAFVGTVNLSLGMQEKDLGRQLNHEYVNELVARGIDPCGESGEFHTIVINGPIFAHPIPVRKGEIYKVGEYASLDLILD